MELDMIEMALKVVVLFFYGVATVGLLLYGLNCYVMLTLFMRRRREVQAHHDDRITADDVLAMGDALPVVTTQIAIYNELNVSERVMRAACNMRYPKGRHEIQVLDDSTDEQSSAGLDQCTTEELARFQRLNDAYKARFDIPFIMAVRGSNRHQILAGFEERIHNEPGVEIERALSEINRIAMLRLETLASVGYPRDLIGYGNTPPAANWPDKARIAVQFVINYEEGAENCVLHGDSTSEAFLSEIVGAHPLVNQRNMNMESIYEYGARAGFWRLNFFDHPYDLQQTGIV